MNPGHPTILCKKDVNKYCSRIGKKVYFGRFQYFNFETNFLENENLFHKTGVLFLVVSAKIKEASFPYKTAISEANEGKDK